MSDQQHFDKLYQKAYTLPTAKYRTLDQTIIDGNEVALTPMSYVGVTNATSSVPVIGTAGFDPCKAVIAYNKKNKKAAVYHQIDITEGDIKKLASLVRDNDTDLIQFHIIGNSVLIDNYGTALSPSIMNGASVPSLTQILSHIQSLGNTVVKTFDVQDKPKTSAVLIDTRNGHLIRGTRLYTTEAEGKKIKDNFHFDDCDSHDVRLGEVAFDGTAEEYQQTPKKRRR